MSWKNFGDRKSSLSESVTELINLGKGKGYLLIDEISDALADEIVSSEDFDSICYLLGDAGIEVSTGDKSKEFIPIVGPNCTGCSVAISENPFSRRRFRKERLTRKYNCRHACSTAEVNDNYVGLARGELIRITHLIGHFSFTGRFRGVATFQLGLEMRNPTRHCSTLRKTSTGLKRAKRVDSQISAGSDHCSGKFDRLLGI